MSTETGAWMPIYWADYFGDTTHLTTEEHGAYLLLIGTYWRRGKPLPDDDAYLAAVAKLTKFRWKNFRKKLLPFFIIREQNGERVWMHKRLEKEILRSSIRLASAKAAGKAGGIAKAIAERKRRGYLVTVTEETDTESSLRSDSAPPQIAEQETDEQGDTAFPPVPFEMLRPLDYRLALFDLGLPWLALKSGRKETALRPLLGKWLKLTGDDAQAIFEVMQAAEQHRIGAPVSWIAAALKPGPLTPLEAAKERGKQLEAAGHG